MRTIVPSKDAPRWLYEVLRNLNQQTVQNAGALAAVGRGEAPDGSGLPLNDFSDYFFLPGRNGGQTSYQRESSFPTLTMTQRILSSTAEELLQFHTSGKMVRFKPNTFEKTCSTDGSTTLTATSGSFVPTGGPTVVPGMLVTGGNIPAGTYVRSVTGSTALTMTASAGAGSLTATFEPSVTIGVKDDETGRDIEWLSRGGVRFTPGTENIPLRIAGDFRAFASGIANAGQIFLEAGFVSAGVATGTQLQIGGPNRGELARFVLRARTVYFARHAATSDPMRVGINVNPNEYTGGAGDGFGADASLHLRPVAGGAAILVDAGTNPGGTNLVLSIRGVPTASSPARTVDSSILFQINDIGYIRSSPVFRTEDASAQTFLEVGQTTGVFSDSVESRYAYLGASISAVRRFILLSQGNAVFDRFAWGSKYTLITNAQVSAASFLAPAATPEVLQIVNAGEGAGADGVVLLKIRTLRAGQTGNLLELRDSADILRSGFNSAGAPFLVAGAGTGRVLSSSAFGVGSWVIVSTLRTRVQFEWRANGPYRTGTEVDGQLRIPTAMTITSVRLYRRTAGSSGSTIVDLNLNGSTMYSTQASRPTVTAAGGNNQASSGTLPDSVAVAAGDVLTIDIDQIEGGTPLDFVLIIEGA